MITIVHNVSRKLKGTHVDLTPSIMDTINAIESASGKVYLHVPEGMERWVKFVIEGTSPVRVEWPE